MARVFSPKKGELGEKFLEKTQKGKLMSKKFGAPGPRENWWKGELKGNEKPEIFNQPYGRDVWCTYPQITKI